MPEEEYIGIRKTEESEEISLPEVLYVLDKRKWLIILGSFVGGVVGLLVSFFMKPVYRAEATILIEKEKPKTGVEEVIKEETTLDYYNTQVAIIKSYSLASAVYNKLQLYNHPQYQNLKEPVEALLKGLKVKLLPATRLINITYEGGDKELIYKICDTWVNTYIEQHMEKYLQLSTSTLSALLEQLALHKNKLEESEKRLQKYVEENKIVNLANVEEGSKVLENLRQQKVNLEIELSKISSRYGEKHPERVKLETELKTVDEKIKEETERIFKLNQATIKYNILKREVDTNRELYDLLLKRVKEIDLSRDLPLSNITIVEPTKVSPLPVRPKKRVNAAAGFLIGIVFFSGMSFLLESLEDTIKSTTDIEQYIKVKTLGFIPAIAPGEIKSEKEVDIFSHLKPHSIIGEAYRMARASILQSDSGGGKIKSLLVTSALPMEGKTTVALNLAIVFSQLGEKVLFVEGDLRKPRLPYTLGFNNVMGLKEYLKGEVSLEEVIRTLDIPHLHVIFAGSYDERYIEVYNLEAFDNFLKTVGGLFDRIVFDSAPVLFVSDTINLANKVDGVIQVVRLDYSKRSSCIYAFQKLSETKSRILGIIVLSTKRGSIMHKYYGYNKYYYSKYYNKT